MRASVNIAANGRMVVPLELRKAIGLPSGGPVEIEVVPGGLRVRTLDQIIADLQLLSRAMLHDHPDAGIDDFLTQRRRDHADDQARDVASGLV